MRQKSENYKPAVWMQIEKGEIEKDKGNDY